jgi:hypothetical protein
MTSVNHSDFCLLKNLLSVSDQNQKSWVKPWPAYRAVLGAQQMRHVKVIRIIVTAIFFSCLYRELNTSDDVPSKSFRDVCLLNMFSITVLKVTKPHFRWVQNREITAHDDTEQDDHPKRVEQFIADIDSCWNGIVKCSVGWFVPGLNESIHEATEPSQDQA